MMMLRSTISGSNGAHVTVVQQWAHLLRHNTALDVSVVRSLLCRPSPKRFTIRSAVYDDAHNM